MAFFGRRRGGDRERNERPARQRGGSFTRDWGERRYGQDDGANPFERPEEFGQNREPYVDPWRREHSAPWRENESSQRASWNDRWQDAYGPRAGAHTDESDYARYNSGRDERDTGTHGAYWSPQRTSFRDFGEESDTRGAYDRGQIATYNRASHRGRGPKGYRRSDDRIREDVCEYLTEDDYIDATNIEVHVQDAEVTLTGHVDTRAEKRRADDLIDQIPGVRDVHNQLRIVNDSGLSEPRKARPPEHTPPTSDQSKH